MRNSFIPEVKTWNVRTVDGGVTHIDAPTRYLALLNFRAAGNYAPITSIAPAATINACAYIRRAMNAERVERIGRNLYRVYVYGFRPFDVTLTGRYIKMEEPSAAVRIS